MNKVVKKLRQFVKEHIGDINYEFLLTQKLLSIGGKTVKLGLDTVEEQKRMLFDGHVYNEKINFVSGEPNKCHRNIAGKYRTSSKHGLKIISGYALVNNEWLQHSWGYNKNGIIETTKIKFDSYYGYELTAEESEEFCFSNN